MLIYGAGGHGRVLFSAARAAGVVINSVFDDDLRWRDWCTMAVIAYDELLYPEDQIVIAIGKNEIREKVADHLRHSFGNIFHPSALIEHDVSSGEGNAVLHRSVLQTGVVLGNHVIVNTGAIVEHDCRIGDFVHIAPGSVLCGGVEIGDRTLIGAGSVVVQGISIGKDCLICAGSVVTRNVPDFAVVRGSPAQVIRYK